MVELQVMLELKSPVLPDTGEGQGSWIDSDVVFDHLGVPYFPARRLKGLLRESAIEVVEMLECCGSKIFTREDVAHIFGKRGSATGASTMFANLKLENYQELSKWLAWALKKYEGTISAENIIATFTEIRQQTAIGEDGIAEENSLRTLRVLKPGQVFTGEITCKSKENSAKLLLALACANLRRVGSGRTRGLGKVECRLLEKHRDLLPEAMAGLKEGIADESSAIQG